MLLLINFNIYPALYIELIQFYFNKEKKVNSPFLTQLFVIDLIVSFKFQWHIFSSFQQKSLSVTPVKSVAKTSTPSAPIKSSLDQNAIVPATKTVSLS